MSSITRGLHRVRRLKRSQSLGLQKTVYWRKTDSEVYNKYLDRMFLGVGYSLLIFQFVQIAVKLLELLTSITRSNTG